MQLCITQNRQQDIQSVGIIDAIATIATNEVALTKAHNALARC